MAGLFNVLSSAAMIGVMLWMGLVTWNAARRQRDEIRLIEAIEELVQLRRWQEAAVMVQGLLAQPTRMPAARVQALIFLATILSRYGRFDDAIAVQEHLLNNVR